MSFRPRTKAIAAATLLGVTLGGCSDIYFDRRDTVSLVSGEAMAANRVTHTIDPWPPASGRREIAYNGEKAAATSERYRTGRVIKPVPATTSSATSGQAPQGDQQPDQSASGGGNNGGNSPGK